MRVRVPSLVPFLARALSSPDKKQLQTLANFICPSGVLLFTDIFCLRKKWDCSLLAGCLRCAPALRRAAPSSSSPVPFSRRNLALPGRALRRSPLQSRTPVRSCRFSLAKPVRLCEIVPELCPLAVAPVAGLKPGRRVVVGRERRLRGLWIFDQA